MDKKVLDRMQTLCSRSEQCSGDIYRKALKALDGDARGASEILASLVSDGYVNDARYAAAFARDKAHIDGWGPVKIRFQLRAKGLDDASIASGLEAVDDDAALSRLMKMLEVRRKSLEGDPQIRLKLLKYALGRGYSYDAVADAVESVLKNG